MKSVLITGATGFIGKQLIFQASSQNLKIFALTRNKKFLDLINKDVIYLFVDYENQSSLDICFNELYSKGISFDIVIHLLGSIKAKDYDSYLNINLNYTKKLYLALENSKILNGKFIYVSSLASVGPSYDKNILINSNFNPKPITFYGKSKLETENWIIKNIKNYLILRPTSVFGPNDLEFLSVYKMISNGFEIYLNNKDSLLSFIYVNDLNKIILDFGLNEKIKNKIYIISNPENIEITSFLNLIKEILKKKTITFTISYPLLFLIAFFSELFGKLTGKFPMLNREKLKEITAKSWGCEIIEDELKEFKFTPLKTSFFETLKWYIDHKLL